MFDLCCPPPYSIALFWRHIQKYPYFVDHLSNIHRFIIVKQIKFIKLFRLKIFNILGTWFSITFIKVSTSTGWFLETGIWIEKYTGNFLQQFFSICWKNYQIFVELPVLGLRQGVDFTFAWDNNNYNNNKINNDKNPHLLF